MQHNTAIFESLFNRKFSDAHNPDFLMALTERHPYFSPAQFFLLQNIKEDTAAFEKQAVKTNLFFNNPHWLNFQIGQTGAAGIQLIRRHCGAQASVKQGHRRHVEQAVMCSQCGCIEGRTDHQFD